MINYKQKFEQLYVRYLQDPINNSTLSEMLVYLSDKDSEIELEKLHNQKIDNIFKELEKSGIYQLIQKVLFDNKTLVDDSFEFPTLKELLNQLKSTLAKLEFDSLKEIRDSLIDPTKLNICNLIEELFCFELSEIGIREIIEKLVTLSKNDENFQLIQRILNKFTQEQKEIFSQLIYLITGEVK